MELADENPRTEDEFEVTEFVADDDSLNQFKLELYHTHLPKLADSGFVDWNTQTKTITRGSQFDEIEPLLTLLTNHQDELPLDWP
ncbi:transcriptional regulator [Natrarchaeobius oligotrophus]|uniref:Transcriptional regulator n=1 Tax=Natrarchaeobius chitinivorans TaxID=1679083 RepID=A0A3N6MQG0_NATCH|nr:transcriptional regulator [Natrarchaeobius chitinivorans]RQG98481.1 transcriptional regulator [Natrarchaeobius chitinivorans]